MTTVGILGVVHNHELREHYRLSLRVIQTLIEAYNPDVICGEVLPASWEKYRQNRSNQGYWGEPPSEYYELIFPLCERRGIVFVPIDWVELDVWLEFDPFQCGDEILGQELAEEWERWFRKQLATCANSEIPFNTVEFDAVTQQKYEWLQQINPQSHLIRWECRHLIMVQRMKNAIKQHEGKRILCIVGADHNHAIHEGLLGEEGIELIYPLSR
ncbi:hypothetical protein DFQ01_106174 [Paenibacillus cellulosilyticus]|uniref:Uncharacterized protein n=1 Tax=Paenibacillus cellulosilyticus TaxID=375489 RepID=A0A2V2YVK7_9BACL|nr:hypothetical protein [Paenibacillus cellulosilyticus]PWW04889.1 hypothetical protein DFQ01_106174 [Paenibacillus cellulosilyticus]QKS45995.1 hypothetical protein HUB94_17245 [Paenibacillus cellulosilyticus]